MQLGLRLRRRRGVGVWAPNPNPSSPWGGGDRLPSSPTVGPYLYLNSKAPQCGLLSALWHRLVNLVYLRSYHLYCALNCLYFLRKPSPNNSNNNNEFSVRGQRLTESHSFLRVQSQGLRGRLLPGPPVGGSATELVSWKVCDVTNWLAVISQVVWLKTTGMVGTVLVISETVTTGQFGLPRIRAARNYHILGKEGQLSTYLCSLQLVLNEIKYEKSWSLHMKQMWRIWSTLFSPILYNGTPLFP